MWEVGYSSRSARSVGVAITASPTQLGWTTRIFEGTSDIGVTSIAANATRRASPPLAPSLQCRAHDTTGANGAGDGDGHLRDDRGGAARPVVPQRHECRHLGLD